MSVRLLKFLEELESEQDPRRGNKNHSVQSLSYLKTALTEATKEISGLNRDDRILLARLLLSTLPSTFLPLLNPAEKQELFEVFFGVPRVLSYYDFLVVIHSVLSRKLVSKSSKVDYSITKRLSTLSFLLRVTVAETIVNLAESESVGFQLSKFGLTRAFSCAKSQLEVEQLIICIGSLPDLVLGIFFEKFSRQLLSSEELDSFKHWNLVVEKLVRIGHAKTFIDVWIDRCIAKKIAKCHRDRIWRDISFSLKTQLVRSLLLMLSEKQVTEKNSMDIFDMHWEDIKPIYEEFLIKNILADSASMYLVKFLHQKGSVVATTDRVAKVWASQVFVHGSDFLRQLFITKLLCELLNYVDKATLEGSGLLMLLVDGVQYYLEAAVPRVRCLGMAVAEKFSYISDPSNRLHFEELHNNAQTYKFEADTNDIHSSTNNDFVSVKSDGNVDEEETAEAAADIDPDEIVLESYLGNKLNNRYVSAWGDSSDEDDESDDEDELLPLPEMDVHDEKKTAKTIFYLTDLQQAMMSEDYEQVEAALDQFPDRIREVPTELPAIAEELVDTVLYLDNRFNMSEFRNKRREILVSLAGCAPEIVVTCLHKHFFAKQVMVGTRLEILETLSDSAIELSSIKPSKVTQELLRSDNDNVGTVLRRWGRPKKPQLEKHKNRFSNYAELFFLPLLQSPKTSMNIFQSEPILLSRVILTLGVLLECAINCVCVPVLAKAMLDLLWWSRFNSEAQVRRATLFAFTEICLCLPRSIIANDPYWIHDLEEIKIWVESVITEDPDSKCREQAMIVFRFLVPIFNS